LRARGGGATTYAELAEALRKLCAAIANRDDAPKQMNDLAMIYTFYHPAIQKVLLGTSKVDQLHNSFAWYATISKGNYQEVYDQLLKIAADYGA